MASMVFEPHEAAGAAVAGVGGGGVDGVVFCVVILCLSALSMIIFEASSGAEGDDEGSAKRPRRSPWRAAPNGPVFVGGRGCACGGCRAGTGAGVCGTYLS